MEALDQDDALVIGLLHHCLLTAACLGTAHTVLCINDHMILVDHFPIIISKMPEKSTFCRPELQKRVKSAAASAPRGVAAPDAPAASCARRRSFRSEENTSELQSLMRISYAVFCLQKKKKIHTQTTQK